MSVKTEDEQEGQQADKAEPGWTGNLGRESGRIITSGAFGATGKEKKTAKGVKDYSGSLESDKELEEIFRRTFGESKREKVLYQYSPFTITEAPTRKTGVSTGLGASAAPCAASSPVSGSVMTATVFGEYGRYSKSSSE